ncbi:MAG: hypothetical protein A3G75_16360 [Verrucomicrobia bacterium RIFCSPLOWO2_12_FULL_64_8]|nr:MAG: hypothetical protein A3G75_16360 [Verrucomicrobia bacterium RIFCSPLOWO2_12_FULL_64_8]
MFTYLLITLVLLILAGLGAVFHAMNNATEGYEDDAGFHAVSVPSLGIQAVVVTAARPTGPVTTTDARILRSSGVAQSHASSAL